MKKAILATAMLICSAAIARVQTAAPVNRISPKQAREERAYAVRIQATLWGRPFEVNMRTLYAGAKSGAIGMNYYRKFSERVSSIEGI